MLSNMIGVLASGLRVDEASVAWLARKLQDADQLPMESDELSPLHAARLLVAILAAARPIDAAAAVAAYEHASMLRVPVVAAGLCCNFVAALAGLIEAAATDPTAPLPAQVSARRSLGAPLGVLSGIPTQRRDPGKAVTLVYGCSSEGTDTMGGEMLEVYGTAPGTVLRAVADLLCPPDSLSERRPHPWSAQPRYPARVDGRHAGEPAARA